MSRAPLTEADLRHEVGTRLRLERESKGLSLRAASELADVAASYLRALEQGQSTPSLPVLVRLVAAYGSSMTRLLGKIGTPPPVTGRLDDAPGWRELSESTLNMTVYQVALNPGERTSMRLSGDGEVLIYVVRGVVTFESPAMDAPLKLGDSVKMRHTSGASWSASEAELAQVLVGIGPSARINEIMSSASLID